MIISLLGAFVRRALVLGGFCPGAFVLFPGYSYSVVLNNSINVCTFIIK
jgi:hypothetical protein